MEHTQVAGAAVAAAAVTAVDEVVDAVCRPPPVKDRKVVAQSHLGRKKRQQRKSDATLQPRTTATMLLLRPRSCRCVRSMMKQVYY